MNGQNENLGSVFRGMGVSAGIVLGDAFLAHETETPVERVRVPETDQAAELERLAEAVAAAEGEIERLHTRLRAGARAGAAHLGILDAQKMMLRDPMLLETAERYIAEEGTNAEWALSLAVTELLELLGKTEDPFFRERGSDVEHVGQLIMRRLSGGRSSKIASLIPEGALLVAHTLSPADALHASRRNVAAFVLDVGTATSHVSIIARSLGIPAVVGLHNATERVATGDRVILDGQEGELIVHPSQAEELLYSRRARRARALSEKLEARRHLPAVTRDGIKVSVRANLDIALNVASVIDSGARGIGLYRTEFLFIDRLNLPTEDEQFETYVQVLEAMGERPVTIRTLDVGGDKVLTVDRLAKSMSPGLRGIRYCLQDQELFVTQLRALLRASVHGNLRLLFPFVSIMAEVIEVKRIVAKVRAELESEGVSVAPRIPLGFMIEVPSAALISHTIAKRSDFLSVGTNDLIQFTLATSREDESLEHLQHPLHPGLLRLLRMTTRSARASGIPVGLCGEMAGDPKYTLLLLALGFTELSMNPRRIPRIKEVLRRAMRTEAELLLDRVMAMPSVRQAADHVESYMVEHFGDIVVPSFHKAPRHAR